MRRGSIIGPLILIAIGVLFLMRNLFPDIPYWDLVARYWPFVLIAWGALRLVEIFVWAAMSKPVPQNGISGGEWAMVFLICMIGGGIYTARHYSQWFPTGRALHGVMMDMGESYDYTLPDVQKPCAANCRVLIESFRGNAKITGAADAVVKASGHQTIRSFQQSEADSANKQTPLELVSEGNQMIVRTNQDRSGDRSQVITDLELTVPAGSTIEAHGRNGDFDVTNVNGSVDISSDNAGVRLANLGGNVRVDLRKSDIVRATDVKGSVDLKGRGQDLDLQNISGPVTVAGTYVGQIQLRNLAQPLRYQDPQVTVDCEKLPGEMHLALGQVNGTDIVGPVRVNARSRDVQLTDFTQSLELEISRGDVTLRAGKSLPRIQAHTGAGDIDLALPAAAKFDLRASTLRGEAHNEFGAPLGVQEARRGSIVSGSNGGPEVRLDTTRGEVTVRKLSSEDLAAPPAPPAPPSPPKVPKPALHVEHE